MKTKLLKHGKWWLLTAILVVALMVVSLSFCAWDNYSLKSVTANADTGEYYDTVALNDHVTLVVDNDGNKLADVGDIVTYGRYWQDTSATGVDGLKPQRWIVVDIDNNNVATLLTEKVVVYGNFWGLDKEGAYAYDQNYYQSTLRSWLNSGRDSISADGTIGAVGTENLRDDGAGSAFSGTAEIQANRGFLDVAFSDTERASLVPKNISGIQGFGRDNNPNTVQPYKTRNNKSSISDLVWVPSYKEIYGNIQYYKSNVLDGTPSEQFQYFKNAKNVTVGADYNIIPVAIAEATDYAWNSYLTASYYNNGKGSRNGYQNITNVNGVDNGTWWWLRSPYPSNCYHALIVYTTGQGGNAGTHHSFGGVRPAVCVQL